MKHLIRTRSNPHWYVCELRGVVFVTWVSENDKEHALDFNVGDDKLKGWERYIESAVGMPVEIVNE